MEHDYSLEKLVSTFSEHASLSDQHQEFVNKMYAEQNPDNPIPEHMINPFNAAKAFAVMADEIKKLKHQLREHIGNQHC